MKKKFGLFLFVFCMAFTLMLSNSAYAFWSDEVKPVRVEEFSLGGIQAGMLEKEVMDKYGTPTGNERYDNRFHTFLYGDNLKISTGHFHEGFKVVMVELTGPMRIATPSGITVGSSVQEVISHFGQGHYYMDDKAIRIKDNTDGWIYLFFYYNDGVITSITLSWDMPI